uniref:SLC12A transporter C-terminal domain-containing protein n=1 Tax=Aplanochytrium stocchinoi TaxID=215587 RepID=A0A7S3LKD5_9STRA
MRVNTVVMGFLDNWKERTQSPNTAEGEFSNNVTVADYVGVIGEAFDLGCGVAILRGEMALLGEDFVRQAAQIEKDSLSVAMAAANPVVTTESVEFEDHDTGSFEYENQAGSTWQEIKDMGSVAVKPVRTFLSSSQGADEFQKDNENQYPVETMKMNEFVNRNKKTENNNNNLIDLAFNSSTMHRRIDVYWFADDGGLTLMLPHLLRQAKQPPWNQCLLRVMAVGLSRREAEQEQVAMQLLLKKLRIKAEVQVVSLEIDTDLKNTDENESELFNQFKKIGELVRATAPGSLMVVVSLPVPPVALNPITYMKWLDALSAKCASPILLVRGSNRDVLTILS